MFKTPPRRNVLLGTVKRWLPSSLIGSLRWLRDRLTPQGRMLRWLERNHGQLLMQPSPTTWQNRHPKLFEIARERLAGRSGARVLSYGCSTGEEAFTLADCLPLATIDAIDINPRSIAIARRNRANGKFASVQFICSGSPPQVESTYDAIFCLSVLRHGQLDAERPGSCAQFMPFSLFAETIEALDRSLKPDGLLFLWGCNFRFADTPNAKAFRAVEVPGNRPQTGAYYGPDNALLPIDAQADFVFEKLARTTSSSPT
jgi:SAM-dependent methyltransferase